MLRPPSPVNIPLARPLFIYSDAGVLEFETPGR